MSFLIFIFGALLSIVGDESYGVVFVVRDHVDLLLVFGLSSDVFIDVFFCFRCCFDML